jgi:hypothetical protein
VMALAPHTYETSDEGVRALAPQSTMFRTMVSDEGVRGLPHTLSRSVTRG